MLQEQCQSLMAITATSLVSLNIYLFTSAYPHRLLYQHPRQYQRHRASQPPPQQVSRHPFRQGKRRKHCIKIPQNMKDIFFPLDHNSESWQQMG